MSRLPWRYFLSLERDFIQTLDFVELVPTNACTYSNQYAKLILLLGSEIDVVAKLLCTAVAPSKPAGNILEYQAIITGAFPGMHSMEIRVVQDQSKHYPWAAWDSAKPQYPQWWRAYNEVKHQRDTYFNKANQANVLQALCGLLVLLLYHYREEEHLQPYPQLLECGFPDFIVTAGTMKLPDVVLKRGG
jgi:hypothetical protein